MNPNPTKSRLLVFMVLIWLVTQAALLTLSYGFPSFSEPSFPGLHLRAGPARPVEGNHCSELAGQCGNRDVMAENGAVKDAAFWVRQLMPHFWKG